MTPEDKPVCAKCIHHYVTHDARFPYGCRAMGFKSQRSPQEQIAQISGNVCLAFQRRDAVRRS